MDLQHKIVHTLKHNDEMCAIMTLLRSETKAVLARHNILLDAPQAQKAASKAHERAMRKREAIAGANEGELVEETTRETRNGSKNKRGRQDEGGNDGDD